MVDGRSDSAGKPFTVGAWCKADSGEGVLVAQVGESHGFSLYLKNGAIRLAVGSQGVLAEARSGAIAAKPFDKVEVGDDSGSPVAGDLGAKAWRGMVEDVRLYWGELDGESL